MKLCIMKLLLLGLLAVSTSGCDEKTTNPDETEGPQGTALTLLPESSLTPGCVNWPAENFSLSNRAGQLSTGVKTGDTAIEFTLKDIEGTSYSLSSLLETKPVLMVFGSFT